MAKRSYENLPLFAANVKVWQSCGLLTSSTQWKVILPSLITLLTTIGIMLKIYMLWGDLEVIIFNCFLVSILINLLVRGYTVSQNCVSFVNFFQNLNNWYEQAEHVDGLDSLKAINAVAAKAQSLTKYSYALTATVAVVATVYPMLIGGRRLSLDIYVPGVDVQQSPTYDIIYGLEVFVVIPFAAATFVPFALLVLISLMFGIGVLRDLQSKLNNLANATNDVMLREIKKCIQYHNRIIKFRNDLEALVSFASFIDNVLFVIMLCMMLFFVSVGDSTTMVLTGVVILLVPFFLIALTYYFANEFSYESILVSQAVYNVNWVEGDKDLRRCVLLMIVKSQKPLQLTSGGMQPLTMEVFQAILRISYSFFSVLQGMI